MSSASVHGQLPERKTILGVLDEQAQVAAKAAINYAKQELHEQAPRSDRGGQHIADQVSARVTKTKTGWQGKASWGRQAHRGVTAAQVVRWVTRGTGVHRSTPGGSKKPIRAKNKLHRLNLGNGVRRWSVQGQRPNQFVSRARERAQEGARLALEHGAAEAARILRGKGTGA